MHTTDFLEYWTQERPTLDWRGFTEKEKKAWLKACLKWTGLPKERISSGIYLMDANMINTKPDLFCLLGETFFGYRGYFGQDLDGLIDCFIEISHKSKSKEVAEPGTKLIIRNADHLRAALPNYFEDLIAIFRDNGLAVEFN